MQALSVSALVIEASRRHFEQLMTGIRQDRSGRPTKGNKAWKMKTRRTKARPGPAF